MLAARIIPVVLYRGTQAVKGVKFASWRSIGHVEQQVKVYAERGVDELLILDIAATPEGRGPDFALVERLTRDLFCPVTVGGGVRSVKDVRELLRCGADKVAVCSSVAWDMQVHLAEESLLREIAETFGRQAIVAVVDYSISDGVVSHCGTLPTVDNAIEMAHDYAAAGAGEIMLQSVDRDGMMGGYDLQAIRALAPDLDVPLIAAGGCGSPEHMREAIEAGASAVAAGAMFCWSDTTPLDCARYLAEHGMEVRI